MGLALLSGSATQRSDWRLAVVQRDRDSKGTSPDDIDRCHRTPECLFDRASKNLEFIVARKDKSWHDEHA